MLYQSRDACTVLDDLRKCHETRNYSVLLSLVEELAILSSRVENFMDMQERYEKYAKEIPVLQKEFIELKTKIREEKRASGEKITPADYDD